MRASGDVLGVCCASFLFFDRLIPNAHDGVVDTCSCVSNLTIRSCCISLGARSDEPGLRFAGAACGMGGRVRSRWTGYRGHRSLRVCGDLQRAREAIRGGRRGFPQILWRRRRLGTFLNFEKLDVENERTDGRARTRRPCPQKKSISSSETKTPERTSQASIRSSPPAS